MPKSPAEPRFRWTGLMILVPVLALGAVGLWQLRQDRAAALADARAEAEDLLEQVFMFGESVPIFNERSEAASVVVSAGGEVLWPKPIPPVPSPVAKSNPHARKLTQLLADPRLSLSEQAHALYELAFEKKAELVQPGSPCDSSRFAMLCTSEIRQILTTPFFKSWAFALTIEAVNHPTILSEKLLHEAKRFKNSSAEENESWNRELETWKLAEASRKFLQKNEDEVRVLLNQFVDQDIEATQSKWIGTNPGVFCQVRKDGQKAFLFLQSPKDIQQSVRGKIEAISIPRHLGVRLWLSGRLVYGDAEAEVLSLANNPQSEVRAEVVFIDREAFFQPVRQRSIRTAWVIALAILAAGVGWFAAWRAFVRQRQLSAMKDNFVSAVSHELKAPIASIGLMAEELGAGSQKRVDYTRLIAGECARLGSLVENVLDYARIESGNDEFAFEDADLGELVRAVAELMRPPASEHGIEIRVDAPPAGKLCATVDARAIGRAVVNLVDNAIKYAPHNEPITVTATEDHIIVADKGYPISASEGRKIFERFYRSGSELTRETKGVGIGLSLVSHIAAAHSGRVRVESGESGNRFIFQIGSEHFNPSTPDA